MDDYYCHLLSIVIDDCSSLALQKEGPYYTAATSPVQLFRTPMNVVDVVAILPFFVARSVGRTNEMDFIQWMLRWVYWVQVKRWQSKQCFTCFTWFQNCWFVWEVWKCKTSERVEVEQKENSKDDLTLAFPEIEGFQPLNVRGPGWTEICHSWTCEIRFDPEVILALNNIGKAIGAAWRGMARRRWVVGSLAVASTDLDGKMKWSVSRFHPRGALGSALPNLQAPQLQGVLNLTPGLVASNTSSDDQWSGFWSVCLNILNFSMSCARMHMKYMAGYGMIWVEFPIYLPVHALSPKAGAIFHRLEDDDGSAEHHGWIPARHQLVFWGQQKRWISHIDFPQGFQWSAGNSYQPWAWLECSSPVISVTTQLEWAFPNSAISTQQRSENMCLLRSCN